MKQSIPTPLAIAIVILALVVIGVIGWMLVNPPEPKPVARPEGQQLMPPAMPPMAPGQSQQSSPQQPGQGAQQTQPT